MTKTSRALVPVFAVIAACAGPQDTRSADLCLEGHRAPAFALQTLDGQRVALSDLRGKVVAMQFGASHCPVTRRTAATFEALRQQYGDRVVFLAVGVGEDPERVRTWTTAEHYDMPVLIDRDGSVAASYAPAGLANRNRPRSQVSIGSVVVIDGDGVVRAQQLAEPGPVDTTLAHVRDTLADLAGG